MTSNTLSLQNNKQRIAASACSTSSKAVKIKVSILMKIGYFFLFPVFSFVIFIMGQGPERVPYSETTQNISLFFAGLIMFAWLLNLVYSKWLQIDIASKEYLVKISLFFIPMTLNRFSLAGARSLEVVRVNGQRYDLIVTLPDSRFFLVSAPSSRKALRWGEKISTALNISMDSGGIKSGFFD
jgi:hypothetical protein